MIAIITGDIVSSRTLDPKIWLHHLKKGLETLAASSFHWEIYRGDSFQFKTTPEDALLHAILLKTWVKHLKEIDVRLSIGIGEQSFEGTKITEANGSAFELSGEGFDALDKKNLTINTPHKSLNDTFRVMTDLSLLIMDKWSDKSAEIIYLKLKNPTWNQTQIAAQLNKKQSTISEALKRGGFEEIEQFINYYKQTMIHYVATFT
ncbi:SatD family protein [Flavobacterium sp. CBA20B-1]|uniref:SatD family protein n=1 Tax=unclassified Flavobacterium TaxID=196869 RepID=UPI0022250CE8|nr:MULTISPECIES: SatD family protein [unclassified Flavobacterium]WCM42512.1 SatD family protein [Flavobacterium sp. CBA20B-1]